MGISTTCRNYFFLYSFLLSVLEGEGGGILCVVWVSVSCGRTNESTVLSCGLS